MHNGRLRRRGMPVFTGRNKRGRDTKVSLPLLTPLTFLCADTSEMCSETGVRGLGSVRRFAFGTLLCPEFTLRDLPRITVRGQTVQGVRLVLRKAPLPSRIYPWSTKRPCEPLAFSRATEGRRGQRKVRGVKRGQETIPGVLSPFAPAVGTAFSGRRRRPLPTPSEGVKSPPAASRCIGGGISTAEGKEKGGRRGLPDRRFLTLKKIFGVFSKKRLTLSLAYANLYTG